MGKLKFYAGNVLFLILIAVALFAALSYAVTQSSSGEGNDIGKESIELKASEILQYSSAMQQTVMRLRLIKQCKDTEISFNYDSDGDGDYTDADDAYNNTNAPESLKCHVFHPEGGGMDYREFDDSFFDSNQSAEVMYGNFFVTAMPYVFGVPELTTTRDLVFTIPYIKEDLCKELNKKLGHGSDSQGTPIINAGNGFSTTAADNMFSGSYNASIRVYGSSNHAHKMNGCIGGQSARVPDLGTYFYYQVLIAR